MSLPRVLPAAVLSLLVLAAPALADPVDDALVAATAAGLDLLEQAGGEVAALADSGLEGARDATLAGADSALEDTTALRDAALEAEDVAASLAAIALTAASQATQDAGDAATDKVRGATDSTVLVGRFTQRSLDGFVDMNTPLVYSLNSAHGPAAEDLSQILASVDYHFETPPQGTTSMVLNGHVTAPGAHVGVAGVIVSTSDRVPLQVRADPGQWVVHVFQPDESPYVAALTGLDTSAVGPGVADRVADASATADAVAAAMLS